MKNKYLTKLLCITMISVMVLSSGPIAAMAAMENTESTAAAVEAEGLSEDGSQESVTVEPTETPAPTPDVTDTPTPTPGESETPTPTPTPGESETPTPTPTPGESETPTPTPPPGETETPTPSVTPTPTPVPGLEAPVQERIAWVIAQIDALGEVTLESEEQVASIRAIYESLSEEEKTQVSNYSLLVQAEETIALLKKEAEGGVAFEEEGEKDFENPDSPEVLEGKPVYVTNAVSNLHAGKDFYLDSLKENYHLEFSDDFAEVMTEIEQEYKAANNLQDDCDKRNSKVTSSRDQLLVRNWQDILAVYVYQQNQNGKTEYKLDKSAKEDLAKIFAEMNPLVRDKKVITKVTYGNLHINDYIKAHKIAKKDRTILKQYVETDCKLLCATVTAAKGFVRQSVGDDVAEERVNVIAAAYSLVGKIGYFWGGKSSVLGWDSSWGSAMQVGAEGSKTTGSLRAYGLDCSGFVTWAFNNGYWDTSMAAQIGDGTTDQWNNALTISESEAQPGDLVFQRGPEGGSDNHVGIICGQTDSGDWIAVHCSSGKNGVTVGEAYSASFRYIRRPACYPTAEELTQPEEETQENTGLTKESKDLNDGWKQLLKKKNQ